MDVELVKASMPEQLYEQFKEIIETLCKRVVSEYRSHEYFEKRCNELLNCLKSWNLWQDKRMTGAAQSETTIYRRLCNISDYIYYNDMSITHLHDLVTHWTVQECKRNPSVMNDLRPIFEKIFVQDQNVLTEQLNDDYEYNARIFFKGMIQGWTQRDFAEISKIVMYYICYMLCVVCLVCIVLYIMCVMYYILCVCIVCIVCIMCNI